MTVFGSSFSDVFASALRGEPCEVLSAEGVRHHLPVSTWRNPAGAGDASVLARCVGPTLDIGCGPGRMTEHLANLGHAVLGIDVVPEAVFQTRERGVAALLRDVFDPLPGEGRWATALLADGNIGIGGDPRALLARAAELVAPGGRVVIDLAPPGTGVEIHTLRLRAGEQQTNPFRWSLVAADAIGTVAAPTGLRVESVDAHGDRWYAVLRKAA